MKLWNWEIIKIIFKYQNAAFLKKCTNKNTMTNTTFKSTNRITSTFIFDICRYLEIQIPQVYKLQTFSRITNHAISGSDLETWYIMKFLQYSVSHFDKMRRWRLFRIAINLHVKAHQIILCSKSLFRDFDPKLPQMGGARGIKILPNNLSININKMIPRS